MKTLATIVIAACCLMGVMLLTGCKINVMGRDIPDREYHESYDKDIAKERQGLMPPGHGESILGQSWDVFWNTIGGAHHDPPTAKSRRLKQYIIKKRRAAGLPELSGITADEVFGLD